jgi:hypothetical protein
MERYFQVEDHGLGHSVVHRHIAENYIEHGKFADAEPHALESAKTWSTMGLLTASRTYEGLGNWDESERWMQEAVEHYPSFHGIQWYLWCRRTGRGDLNEAKRHADEYCNLPWFDVEERGAENEFVYAMLDGRNEDALALVQTRQTLASQSYYWLHAGLLAKRLGNEELYQAQMAKVMEEAKGYEKSDPLYYGLVKILYDHRNELLPEASLAESDRLLAKFVPWSRCNFEYFIGEFLALQGNDDRAEEYWRRAVANGPFDKWNATFAGDRLVKKHGTSRPDGAKAATDESVSDAAAGTASDES